MGKNPAFLFYPNDYLGGTMGFDLEMHGAYILMLIFQFNNGPFPESATSIIKDVWPKIVHKFKKNIQGFYFNERLQDEIDKRKKYSDSRAQNIGSRWSKNDKPLSGKKINSIHMNNMCNTHVIHMENENENENEDRNRDENETEIDPIYRACSERLKERITEHRQAKIDEKKLVSWDRDVRLMMERDGRSQSDILKLIDECHDMAPTPSGFTWRDNILSMDTLRRRWNEGKIGIGMNAARNTTPYGRQALTKEILIDQMEFLRGDTRG